MGIPRSSGELVRQASTPLIHRLLTQRLGSAIGLDNIPRTGPLVVIANHSSYLDHFAMLTLLHALRPGEVWFPTKSESFEKFASRAWHESMNCYPVDRSTPGEQVFDIAQRILAQDNILVLYPEGTRGDGETLLPFKTGAFRMAIDAGAPVVPVGTCGLASILPKGVHVPQPGLYSLSVGPVMEVPDHGETRDKAREMRDDAVDQIIALREQACDNNGLAAPWQIDAIVELAQRIIAENMSQNGDVTSAVVGRLQLLLGLADAMASRHPGLDLQRNRVRGFRALQSRGPGRMIRAAIVNREATRASAVYRYSDFAAYLAGRTSLLLPRFLGGGSQQAAGQFEQAAERGGVMTSQAYVGLAESRLADDDQPGAVDAYHLALDSIPDDDPRGSLRRARIDQALTELGDRTRP